MNRIIVLINNFVIFLASMAYHCVPPWKWGRMWNAIEERHRQEVHKDIWELKKRGRIIERDGRLYTNDKSDIDKY